jgi:type II secretory pathway pseudopilin PulG
MKQSPKKTDLKFPWTRQRWRRHSLEGLTLVELMIAVVLTTVVILILGSGFVSALNASKVAEASTARRTELNRAFDFMTNEIRMARFINRNAIVVASGTTTVADVVAGSGLDVAKLGSTGTIALYLEIPFDKPVPASCPAGGPNANVAPPSPSDVERVVYDIRPSSQGWLGPRSINRYGRVPNSDGSINPCRTPIGSDVLIDAISSTMAVSPTCSSGVLAGAEGFQTCVNGAQVDVFLQSNLSGAKTRKLESSASSRLVALNLPELSLEEASPRSSNLVPLRWSWFGAESGMVYKLYQSVGSLTTEIYSGTNLNFTATVTGNPGDSNCFTVKASIPPHVTAESNSLCYPM